MNTAQGLVDDAARLLAGGEYDAAIEALGGVSADSDVGERATYLLACAHLYSDNLAEAEQLFAMLLEGSEHRANAAYYLGDIALRRNAHGRATCFFSGALAFDPTHKSAQSRLSALGVAPAGAAPQPIAPAAQPAAAAPKPPVQLEPDAIAGVVTDVRGPFPVPTMAGPSSAQQIDIDFDQCGADGSVIGQGYVYVRGVKLKGSVRRGHWIELLDRPDPDGRVRRLKNLTTKTELSGKSSIFFPGS